MLYVYNMVCMLYVGKSISKVMHKISNKSNANVNRWIINKSTKLLV